MGRSDHDIMMEDQLDDSEDTSESEEEDDEQSGKQGADNGTKQSSQPSGFMPKTRVLMLTSRGVTHRYVSCTHYH